MARDSPPSWPDTVPDVPTPDVPTDLSAQLATATSIAASAAATALSYFHRSLEWIQKGPTDLVSVADRTVERQIHDALVTTFPDDEIIGEEGTGGQRTPTPGTRRWYVDPIDGTTNFLKGLPTWGISMGLADGSDQLLLGVIILPVTGEVFTAARGQGAARNGVPIRCSDADRLERTVITYALESRAAQLWGTEFHLRVRGLMGKALGTRMQGCSVADLTSVAMGRIDATVAGGMSEWDVAAGLLIAAEAGAMITTPLGCTSTGPDTAFVVSPPAVHQAIRNELIERGPGAGVTR